MNCKITHKAGHQEAACHLLKSVNYHNLFTSHQFGLKHLDNGREVQVSSKLTKKIFIWHNPAHELTTTFNILTRVLKFFCVPQHKIYCILNYIDRKFKGKRKTQTHTQKAFSGLFHILSWICVQTDILKLQRVKQHKKQFNHMENIKRRLVRMHRLTY